MGKDRIAEVSGLMRRRPRGPGRYSYRPEIEASQESGHLPVDSSARLGALRLLNPGEATLRKPKGALNCMSQPF